jgi:NADH-quinone oxidoreductase subunit L
VQPVLGVIGLLTAVLTALYTFRMVFLAFCGEEKIPEGVHPHESGVWMLIPLLLLAAGAFVAGYAGVSIHRGGFAGFIEPHGRFHAFLAPVVMPFKDAALMIGTLGKVSEANGAEAGHSLMYGSALLAAVGIIAAYVLYIRRRDWAERVRSFAPEIYTLLHNKYFIDETYDAVIVRPLWQIGRLLYAFDRVIIDGLIWFVAWVPQVVGSAFRVLQNGALQGYGIAMTGGLALIVLIVWLTR